MLTLSCCPSFLHIHYNPPHIGASAVWITQKSTLHFHTLSLLLLHFLSLYLFNHCPPPPPFSQWCDGPHCGVVVVLHSRTLFFLFFFPDAPQKDVSFPAHSLGRLTSGGVSFQRRNRSCSHSPEWSKSFAPNWADVRRMAQTFEEPGVTC